MIFGCVAVNTYHSGYFLIVTLSLQPLSQHRAWASRLDALRRIRSCGGRCDQWASPGTSTRRFLDGSLPPHLKRFSRRVRVDGVALRRSTLNRRDSFPLNLFYEQYRMGNFNKKKARRVHPWLLPGGRKRCDASRPYGASFVAYSWGEFSYGRFLLFSRSSIPEH